MACFDLPERPSGGLREARVRAAVWGAAAGLLVAAAPAWAGTADDAVEIALRHLRSGGQGAALAGPDLDELVVTDVYDTPSTGTTHVYLRQQLGGIDVHGSAVAVAIDASDRVVFVGDRLYRGLPAGAGIAEPSVSPEQALRAAAAELGLELVEPIERRADSRGPASSVVLSPSGVSRDEIPVTRVYLATDDGIRLSWNLSIREPGGRHWWNVYVDAATGRLLRAYDWVWRETYDVYPLPLTSPDDGDRVRLSAVADPEGSPFGWHDTNGVTGAEFNDTRGNNVQAQEDVDGDDLGGARPNGGAALAFEFPLDLDHQPGNYIDASVTNLFYWSNICHDVHYRYGFDEAAGNFQQNNYGAGGSGSDAVIADAQDAAEVNNARIVVPPDGRAPRMEMFRFLPQRLPRLIVSTPSAVSGSYPAGSALFGAGTPGLVGNVVGALDASDAAGPATTDACSPITNMATVTGSIAIVDRGDCFFIEKAVNVQAAGAIGMIVVNNAGDGTINMAGIDSSITIPSVFVGQSNGQAIMGQLAGGVRAEIVTPAARDSSLDNTIIVHEYGHGVSVRLTGGPSEADCLAATESRGMGEGWSDFWALAFTAMSDARGTDARGVGTHATGDAPDEGLRNFPYSTDPTESPLTYVDIASLNRPHGIGEVWAGALWQMYWNLVDEYGFDPDLYEGTGGNNIALELVMDALKLQPCQPTFVDGRDALLAADRIANDGANACAIWEAFAKRGIGEGADDGGSADDLSVVESFDVPIACPEPSAALLAAAALVALAGTRRSRAI